MEPPVFSNLLIFSLILSISLRFVFVFVFALLPRRSPQLYLSPNEGNFPESFFSHVFYSLHGLHLLQALLLCLFWSPPFMLEALLSCLAVSKNWK